MTTQKVELIDHENPLTATQASKNMRLPIGKIRRRRMLEYWPYVKPATQVQESEEL